MYNIWLLFSEITLAIFEQKEEERLISYVTMTGFFLMEDFQILHDER